MCKDIVKEFEKELEEVNQYSVSDFVRNYKKDKIKSSIFKSTKDVQPQEALDIIDEMNPDFNG